MNTDIPLASSTPPVTSLPPLHPRTSAPSPTPSDIAGTIATEERVAAYVDSQLAAARQQQQDELAQTQQALRRELARLQQMQANPPRVDPDIAVAPAKPKHFSSERGADPAVWLFQIDQYFELANVTRDSNKVRLAATYLDGPAATWWRGLHNECTLQGLPLPTWTTFKARLVAQFKPVNSSRVARDKLSALRQFKSVAQYNTDFTQLVLDAGDVGAVEQLYRYKQGLKPKVRLEVELADPTTLQEAMQKAQTIDSLTWYLTNPRSNMPNRPPPNQSNYSGHAPMDLGTIRETQVSPAPTTGTDQETYEEALNAMSSNRFARPPSTPKTYAAPAMTKEEYERCRKNGLCLKCKKSGHIARFCTTQGYPKHNDSQYKGNSQAR
jgi:hypothetical protein